MAWRVLFDRFGGFLSWRVLAWRVSVDRFGGFFSWRVLAWRVLFVSFGGFDLEGFYLEGVFLQLWRVLEHTAFCLGGFGNPPKLGVPIR